MAQTAAELSAPHTNYMVNPQRGSGYCEVCFTFTYGDPPYSRCYQCSQIGHYLDAMAPISYSENGGQLHTDLRTYKRGITSRRVENGLAAVLSRFLAGHQDCLAAAAGAYSGFDLVTTVPSSSAARDTQHPLHRIVGQTVRQTATRFNPLLARSTAAAFEHQFSTDRFEATRPLDGESVLLVDDTWTTGANAQSAAAALQDAGAGQVAAVVIGRHVNDWDDNFKRLAALPTPPFDWDTCVWH